MLIWQFNKLKIGLIKFISNQAYLYWKLYTLKNKQNLRLMPAIIQKIFVYNSTTNKTTFNFLTLHCVFF